MQPNSHVREVSAERFAVQEALCHCGSHMRLENPHPRTPRRVGLVLVPFLALAAAGCEEPPPEDLTHDFVKVQMLRSQAAADTPYTGTSQITITMSYDSCFVGFYQANPSFEPDGIEGGEIFGSMELGGEGWRDRLCDPTDAGQAACTVVSFNQELDAATQLTVTYAVEDVVENRFLKFGPLPLVDKISEFTCDGGSPRVQVDAQRISGVNAGGTKIWSGEAVDTDVAAPGQGKAIQLRARRE